MEKLFILFLKFEKWMFFHCTQMQPCIGVITVNCAILTTLKTRTKPVYFSVQICFVEIVNDCFQIISLISNNIHSIIYSQNSLISEIIKYSIIDIISY